MKREDLVPGRKYISCSECQLIFDRFDEETENPIFIGDELSKKTWAIRTDGGIGFTLAHVLKYFQPIKED